MSRYWDQGSFCFLFYIFWLHFLIFIKLAFTLVIFCVFKILFSFEQIKCFTFIIDKYRGKNLFSMMNCELSCNLQERSEVLKYFNNYFTREQRNSLICSGKTRMQKLLMVDGLHSTSATSHFLWVKSSI